MDDFAVLSVLDLEHFDSEPYSKSRVRCLVKMGENCLDTLGLGSSFSLAD